MIELASRHPIAFPHCHGATLTTLSTSITKDVIDDLKAFAGREDLRYQQIPGLQQPQASDRAYLDDIIFDRPRPTETLLDIGSNLGYFCLDAIEHGMHKAVGIDTDPENIRKSIEISRIIGHDKIEYIEGDFEKYDFNDRKFETILCLNVLHHLFDPIHTLRKMIELSNGRIIIEFAAPTMRDIIMRRISIFSYIAMFSPSIVLGKARQYTDGSRIFLFGAKAMRLIFEKHYAVFDTVRVQRSPFKGRYVLVAVRRRIARLVVVAGLNAAGKSTLVSRLKSDPGLRRQAGMEEGDWPVADASSKRLPDGELATAIFHYDLLHAFGRSTRTIDRDVAIQLLRTAEKVTVLTLATPLPVLKQRLEAEIKSSWRPKKRQRRILENYSMPGFADRWLAEWFSVCAREVPAAQHTTVRLKPDGSYEFLNGSGLDTFLEHSRQGG